MLAPPTCVCEVSSSEGSGGEGAVHLHPGLASTIFGAVHGATPFQPHAYLQAGVPAC